LKTSAIPLEKKVIWLFHTFWEDVVKE
jgi:hypothetical protein